ncbi:sulfotransferase family protein [Nocardioides pacificus]
MSSTPAETRQRRVVFVVGSGRSGTSTMVGTLQTLGLHVPQPEVSADVTNPKGFGEPQWVVDLHAELLQRCNVGVSDARPQAWFEAGKLSTLEPLRERLHTWLEAQFEHGDELVIKDPRLAWFLGLWRSAALRCGATPLYVTMLRPPTEVVGSKSQHYTQRFGEVNRTAAWVNMMLHTERATRGSQRAYLRYEDLLEDWTVPLFNLGETFDLQGIKTATANDIRMVHNFIDPSLRRVSHTWDDIVVPARLREVAEESWQCLDSLADAGGDEGDVGAKTHARLDELRTVYAELYEEAEAMTQSTAVAAARAGEAAAPGAAPVPVRRTPPLPAPPPAGPPAGLADKIPHRVRAMVPPAARRGIRKAIGRER